MVDRVRRLPRFVHETRVEIRAADGAELRTLWTRDISSGGLFVATDDPPPVDTLLDLAIEVADGRTVTFEARVVYALEPAKAARIGTAAGVGLQLVGMTAEQRRAIEDHIDRLSGRPPDTVDLRPPSGSERTASITELDARVDEARCLVEALDGGDLYAALGIDRRFTCEEIDAYIKRMIHRFVHAPARASSPRRLRLDAACTHLEKVRRLLADADRRLEYDFRAGFVDVDARMAAARHGGPSVARLRDAWRRALPQRLRDASIHTGATERFERAGDFASAAKEARVALDLDPFNEGLRKKVEELASRAPANTTRR